MTRSIPRSSHSNLRVFIACLLSFMTLMAPIIPVAAAVKGAVARTAPKPAAKANLTPEEKMESYLFKPTAAAPPVGPVITATKKDTFNDPNLDGKAELNDVVTYDVNINNAAGSPDATGVNFTDTIDPNTTFVPGSLKVSPLAFADTYFATKNTALDTAASSLPGVLANDTGIPAPTVAGIVGCADVTAPFVCTTTHGSVTLNANGSFTYTPTAGYEGPDSFIYTATNGLTPDDTATVTINVDAPPSVTSTTPVNGAVNQTTTPTITINFSESVSATATAFKIECPTGTPQTFTQSASPAASFTLTPTTALPAGTTCTVTVVANQITDTDTNDPPDNMVADFTFSFTTDAAPTVTSTTPVNGAPSVATNTTITVNFSESVAATTSSFTLECPVGTPKTFTLSASPASTFTLTPTAALPAGTTCTVTVIANQIHDTDAFDPPDTMAANFVFSFTTDAAPSVLTTSPTNGATGVTTDATITVNFSESVAATTSSFTLECPVGTPKAFTLSASPASSFTLTPTGGLPGGVTCTVTVIANQIHDSDSVDPPDTMVANFVFSFTTDAAPTVLTVSPTNGSTGIGGNAPITVNFSESVNATTSSFTLECPVGTPVPFTLSASPASSFTLTPTATMPAGTVCTVTVIANQIHDADTFDPPDTMAANFVFSFTIDVAPTVQSTSPVNGAINVAENANITVTFSEPVTATGSSFTLECPTGTAKAFTVSGSGTSTITLSPTATLPPGVICTVTVIANQISDVDSGDPPDNLVSNFVFSFGVRPRAVDDVRTATGNIRINTAISGFSVLTNDLPAGISVTASDTTSAHGGNVSVAANGTFTYNPPPGYTGADTFNYTISNAAGSDVGTVTINISNMIWFIDDSAPACTTVSAAAGCGRNTNPLSTLAAFEAANGNADVPLSNIYNPQAGDNIFIYSGNYTAPLTLENTQRVIGQGATSSILTLTGITLAPDSDALPNTGGTAPVITSGGIGIDVKQDDSLYGLALSNTTGNAINSTANIATFVLADVTVNNSTTNGGGIILDDGGTSITATGLNTINTRSATALNITNIPITSSNVTFRSISAGNNDANADPVSGIILNNTGVAAGNGGLIVTGNSAGTCGGVVNTSNPVIADCTGGTIQNSTGTGISLTSTKNVSLTRMYVFNNADSGIKAITVSGISVISSDIDSNDNSNSNNASESGMFLSENYGTATITNSWISESFNTDLRIENSNVTNGALTVNMSGDTIMNSGASNSLANVFNFLGTVTSNMTLNMSGSRIKGNQGAGALTTDGLRADTSGGNMTLNVGTTTFQNNFVALDVTLGGTANAKHLTFDIHDNPTITGNAGTAINVTAGGTGLAGDTVSGKLRNNVIGTSGVTNSGSLTGFGMDIDNESLASYNISITGNTIREIQTFDGIFARQIVQPGSMNATITGNTFDQIRNSGASNVFAINSAVTVAGGTICANISGNTLTNVDPNNFGNGKKIRARQTSGTYNLTQASANALATANGLPAGQAETLGTINFNQPPCATPPLMIGNGGVEAEIATAITDNNIVSDANLNAIVEAAIQRWTAAGLSTEQIASMRRVKFEVADLSDSYLAEAADNLVRVDKSAGGNGWFIDTTPQDDAEFTYVVSGTHRYTTSAGTPAGRIDLLTAIIHELGHEIGLSDSYLMLSQNSVMYGYLVKGERRLPFQGQAVGAHHSALDGTHFLTGPTTSRKSVKTAKAQPATSTQIEQATSQTFANRAGIKAKLQLAAKSLPVVSTLMPAGETVSATIGTLRANKTVHIQFQVTITSIPASAQVSNQGTVSGNFSNVVTDDPDTAAAGDPTITPVIGIPVANDDSYSTFKDTPLNIAAPGVLSNDTNSPTVSAVGGCADVTTPFNCTTTHGSVVLNADGSFTYTPTSGYTGPDSFDYTATNPAGSDTATVNITVTDTSAIYINEVLFNPPGTDAPNEYIELRGPANSTIAGGTYFVAIEGDSADNPGDVQTLINLSGLTFGSNGFLVLLQNGNTYTTAAGATVITSTTTGFSGLPGGIFQADGGATDIEDASVTFMLVQTGVAPTLTDDIDANNDGTPDGSVYGGWSVRDSIGVLDGTSATDRAYGAINFSNNTGTNGTATGTVVLVGFTAGYVGRIGDSTGSAAADWVASVPAGAQPNFTLGNASNTEPSGFANKPLNHIGASNFVNLPPVNSVPASVNAVEDTTFTFNGANTISISDPDANSAEVKVTLTATNGTMSLSGTVGLTFTPPSGSNDGVNDTQMIFTGTISAINTALSGMTFMPTPNFNGVASIQIVTDDQGNTGVGGALTDTDTITINVGGINDAPTLDALSNATIQEDAGLQTVNLSGITAGPGESQTLTVTAVSNNTGIIPNPTVTYTSPNSTGSLSYTPVADANGGPVTITVTVMDNGGTAGGGIDSFQRTFTVTVTEVNDAPVATDDTPPDVLEDSGANNIPFSTLLANDSKGPANESGQTLTITAVSNPTGGTVQIVGTNVVFTPTANYSGPASFDYTVTDNGTTNGSPDAKSDTGTATFNVTAVNDAPTLDALGNLTIDEDAGTQTVNLSGITAGPGESQTLTVTAVSNNTGIIPNPTVTYTSPNSTGSLSFAPVADKNGGPVTITVTVTDNGGTAGGGVDSFQRTFTVTVTAVNDAPTFQIPSNPPAVNEDAGAQTVNSFATNFQPGPPTATDESGQTLVGYTVTLTGTTGNLTFTSGPSIDNAGTLTYTPSANVSGTATFNVVATDSGSGIAPNVNQSAPVAFTITVTGQNDAPVLDNSGNMSLNAINEDVANASNPGTLVSDIIASAGGDRITDVDAGALEGLAIIAADNTNGTWQFSIDNGTNWTPFGSPDQTTARLLASDANTRVRFVPNANFNGTVDPGITFRAWDQTSGTNGGTADTSTNGGTSAFSIMTETASIAVNPVNDQPTANPQTVGTNEDTPVGIVLTGSDVETASGNLIYNITAAPANGVLTGTGANRTYTPNPNYNGPDSFKFTVTDTGDGSSPALTSAEATVTINVGAVNDAPTADSQSVSTNEDTAKAITLTGSDIDTPAGSLTYIIVTGPSHGTVSPGAGPNRTYTPTANYNGPDSFTFKINDGTTDSNVATVSITVNPVNDTPTANAQSVSTNEDTPLGITLAGSDTETASGSLVFNVTVQPTHGTLTGTGANRTYTPNADYNGPDSFKFTVTDTGDGASPPLTSSEATVTITVNGVNDAPVNSIPGPQGATKNGQLVFSAANSNLISISDADAGSNSLKVTLTATHGTITLSGTSGLAFTVGDGTKDATMTFTGNLTNINAALNGLIFEPTNGYDGPATIQITTDDQGNTGSGGAMTDTDTINITVNKGGVLSFSSATYTVAENAGSITITVNRLGGSNGTTKVDYTTSNGTAIAGQDYTTASGQLTFNNGVTTQTFVVPITNDALNEAPETVNLTLSNVSGSGDLGSPATAVLTITDDDATPSLSINDATVTEGNSGTVNAVFTVTLSAQSGQTVTVNYATANGTATAGSDYQAQSNTLTFAPGETTKTISVVVNGDTASETDENFFVNLSGATNASISDAQGVGTIVSDDSPVIQFSASTYTVAEDALRATITVNRLGDVSKPATVDYATSDSAGLTNCNVVNGIASSRCDYAVSIGTIRFAANEASRTISIPIVNDVYVEGPESFTITLSHQTGGELGSPTTATITITDNDNGGAPNPIDDNAFFIRQLYIDFLGREPDPPGLRGWLAILNNCPVDDTSCDRVHIAEGFARSDEFAGRGYFIYRIYRTSFGRKPAYAEFIPDMAKVSGFLNAQDLEANKQAFVDEFVTRTEFRTKYDSLDNSGYVNALEATALVTLPNKQALIDDLNAGRKTRAQVLRAVIETTEVYTKYYNEAFVVMEYFGFLRRDPDALYQNWIDQFNHSNIYRLVISGFVNSLEYRIRFGQ
jgi:methionine-rich copper-binding protein CopC